MNASTVLNADECPPADLLRRLDSTEFLTRCRAGSATYQELGGFLVQHYFYARNFPRYLCALIANLSNDQDRTLLTENLLEEMGYGGGDTPHAEIYRNMLLELRIFPKEHGAAPSTSALTTTMFRLCSDRDSLVGLGALWLGAEAIVPHVYQQILNGLLAAGFPARHLEFFRIHIDGDDAHAVTMQKVASRLAAGDSSRRQTLLFSAALAIERRRNFFDGLKIMDTLNFGDKADDVLFDQL